MSGSNPIPVSFRQLMTIKEIKKDVFESQVSAFSPGNLPMVGKRAYGGHVYAQAAWAACKTVDKGFYIHNVTGHFLLAGLVDVPFIYHVKRVRDGGSYCLRSVEVFQVSKVADQGRTPCFVSTISFKRTEKADKFITFGHQHPTKDHIRTEYDIVLRGKKIEDHPPAPRADVFLHSTPDEPWQVFPGCETRKVDMRAYNGPAEVGGGHEGEIARKWRQLTFYRIITMEDDQCHEDNDDLNLHAAAHLYASDRNSLFMVLHALGYPGRPSSVGSLAHTVVFHGDAEDMRMIDMDKQAAWFVQEAWSSYSGANRACHNSRLWNYAAGTVIATTIQDGMMRVPLNPPKL